MVKCRCMPSLSVREQQMVYPTRNLGTRIPVRFQLDCSVRESDEISMMH